jgi:flagellar motor switch protein FliG
MVAWISGQLPKKLAKQIRRRLAKLGPTRLSDMEGAQRAIARIAARRRQDLALAAV